MPDGVAPLTVSWLLQYASDVPEADDWLSAAERGIVAAFTGPKRRRDWRLGRWTAKRALAAAGAVPPGVDPASLARLSIEATGPGAPVAWSAGAVVPWTVSISHAGDRGLSAVAPGRVALGCDIETVARRGEALVVDWFTPAERAQIPAVDGEERSRRVMLIWSAKESALKALGTGLRAGTRHVSVAVHDDRRQGDWGALTVCAPGARFEGWWQIVGESVVTIVADPPASVPARLR